MKTTLYWAVAIFITLTAVIYQRATGPTYPKVVKFTIENVDYRVKLLRSHGGETDAPIELALPVEGQIFKLHYRKFPTNNEFKTVDFEYKEGTYVALLPNQPPAGKLAYYIEWVKGNGSEFILKDEPNKIRYKGDVPQWVLVPHIFLMFFAMLLSNLTGIMAGFGNARYKIYAFLTFVSLTMGGLILGPIVQLYAFGDLWTGVPFGWDLTDNKTLIAWLVWLAAIVIGRKKESRGWVIAAAVVLLAIYSIPHSMFGSELNHETGDRIQGMIPFFVSQ